MAIIGASDAVRTKSTAEIYGDELKKIYQDDENVVVRTRKEISEYRKAIDDLKVEMGQNPNKKFVLDFPLFVKEFSMANSWLDKKGNLIPYARELMKAVNNDHDQAVIKWVETDGEINGVKGSKPSEIAQLYKNGFERLKKFVEEQVPDRPVFIGGAGHSWDLDVFIAYMTHGKVTEESVKEIMGEGQKMIKETEGFYFNIGDKNISGRYRGKDYELPLE